GPHGRRAARRLRERPGTRGEGLRRRRGRRRRDGRQRRGAAAAGRRVRGRLDRRSRAVTDRTPAEASPEQIRPTLDERRAAARVVALPMRVRFRGITAREVLLVRGPAGWGEFAPFPEYGDTESAAWLRSAIESAWVGPPPPRRASIEVNATVP